MQSKCQQWQHLEQQTEKLEVELTEARGSAATNEKAKSKLEAQCRQFELDLDKLKKANEQLEAAKHAWSSERIQLVARKDDELQKTIGRLEKRFEEDYTRFVQTHKEGMQRALNEKSAEHASDRDKLIEMYERRISESEQIANRRSKDMRDKLLVAKVSGFKFGFKSKKYFTDQFRFLNIWYKLLQFLCSYCS